jgi:Pyruvate/2-oxoacid:ferredoxin oxidoreductase delta subunit
MRFPLKVVVTGKKDINCRSCIKYVDNMDLKNETDDLDGNISKRYVV